MEAPCFSISAQESFVMYAKSKRHNKNQLLISRKYRTLSPNASVQHRMFLPTLHRDIPNPINRRQNT